MARIWGFDLGTTSVGFAVVDHDEAREDGRVLRLGVRIFPEGVEATGGGSTKAPPNQRRRAARLLRRQLRRRRRRRQDLGRTFQEAGLLPPFDPRPESDWSRLMACDPYALRAAGLDRELPPMALGRALYHLAQRRGFRPRREGEEDGKADDAQRQEEKGVVEPAINELRRRMAGRTLGAFLGEREAKRGHHLGRDMVGDEFERLWAAQARHRPDLLTNALKEDVRRAIFFQRPTFWRLKTLGRCRLEPDAPLCLKGSSLGQRFLLLQRLNNLRFAFGNQRPLDAEERALVLAALEARPSVTFGEVRKILKPLWRERDLPLDAKFNFEVSATGPKQDKQRTPGNALEAALAKVFGDEWAVHPARERIRQEITERLRAIHYRRVGGKRIEIRSPEDEAAERDRFIAGAQADYRVTAEQAAKLADLKLPSGWLRLSEAAIAKLLPHLEAGSTYAEALDLAYPGHREPDGGGLARLPSHPRHMPDLRNPTVARTLTELRKVVNNLLAVYGKPDRIRVELARDLKLSARRKGDLDKRQRRQEKLRAEATEELTRNGFAAPSRDDVDKWLLWKECQETCPYTGRRIGFDALFRTGEFQVEHIFPRSRSLDDGLANKTLCTVDENHRKRNRTPFEAYGHDPERWHEIKLRLKNLGLPEDKVRRFVKESFAEVGTEEFDSRQLTDTAYAARAAREYLIRLGVPVEPCNGRVTAQLRWLWGLDRILNPEAGRKIRDDHRHHAVDALAVALTSRAFVKRLSEHYARERAAKREQFPPPWPSLWADAKRAVEVVVVSHRAQRKVSGPLHSQTAHGDTGEEVVEKGIAYRFFVTRKSLEGITPPQIDAIRDPVIHQLVKEHVASRGGDPKRAFPPFPTLVAKKTGEVREIRRVRILIKQQKSLIGSSGKSRGITGPAA